MDYKGLWSSIRKWLHPGMGIKRWLVLLAVGLFSLSLGVSFLYVEAYRAVEFPKGISPLVYALTLQFLPHWARGLILCTLGLLMVAISIYRVNRSLLKPFVAPGKTDMADILYRYHLRAKGPKIVAIGGGHGLSTLLRGLKEHTSNLTAIVTVADDGGSSGRLRQELGLLPPGDFRNCITALADKESLMTELFQYRFGEGTGLDGHSFGNLFIAAMAGVTGDFERAVLESSKVLAVRGRILPSTLTRVTLWAELGGAETANLIARQIEGESRIPKAGAPIERVFLRPEDARGYSEAVQSILEADLIVVGPGSLYTSILPNLLVSDIVQALRAARALKIYVCNVATQPGETDGYTVGSHIRALEDHIGSGVFDIVLANNNFNVMQPPNWKSQLVHSEGELGNHWQLVRADLIDPTNPWRHNSEKLAREIMRIYQSWEGQRTSAR